MTDTSEDDPYRSMIRSGSTTPALSSFMGSYTRYGMVYMWFYDETGHRGRRFHMVSYQKFSKLTNLMKIIRIEGYNGK